MYSRQFDRQRVSTPEGSADLHINLVGPGPIIQHFINRMNLVPIINQCLGNAPASLLDHGKTLSVLIQNILLSPAPLYRIAQWAEPISSRALGLEESDKAVVNDDRVARSLDVLASER